MLDQLAAKKRPYTKIGRPAARPTHWIHASRFSLLAYKRGFRRWKDVAEATGVSYPTIRNIYAGNTTTSEEVIAKLLKGTGITVEQLVSEKVQDLTRREKPRDRAIRIAAGRGESHSSIARRHKLTRMRVSQIVNSDPY